MSKKQKTLYESWNKSSTSSVPGTSNNNLHSSDRNVNSVTRFSKYNSSLHQSTSSPFEEPRFPKKSDELADPEFDYEAGKTWIYPTNYPLRDYQFSIVQEALYKNTLVILPTGLGKTFIAAVVMYNIYRWFPNGKVVFMAPTKPLVAQQVNACFNITGISEDDTTQMTGTNIPELRKKMWQKKRVFFLTPQVLVNDLVSNICPASSIKCLVIDEAHKALGNHAYCQVVKELLSYTSNFRVLALTATPGSDIQAVKQVLTNLLISHVELRSEDSEDVKKYSHIRDIEKIVVPLGVRLNNLKNRFLDVINVYLKRLILRKVMPFKNPASLSKFQIFNYRQEFNKHPPATIDSVTYGLSMADFSLCISLYHAYELLLLHGTTSFYNYLSGILNGDKSIPHARSELSKNVEFGEIMRSVKETYIPDPTDQNTEANGQGGDRRVLPSHPKLDKLLEVVLQHFERSKTSNIADTRVMIFTQYRDSVQEIVAKLSQYQPTVKVTSFIGQSSRSSSSVGYSQKQQLMVIQKFRSGGYNTLVSTCVGEEGLDIGEVDLIVCFDCPSSPIRLVQRIGRTGRLRNGRIVFLITEGKEEQMFNACKNRKKGVYQAMAKGFCFAQFYQNNPSLIPSGVRPICEKTAVTIKPKKLVVRGASKSPYLTDEEMMEFNQHVRVPQTDAPLLPKQEFDVLRNHERIKTARNGDSSTEHDKPQLSLSEWTLWQTTPQRTDMISHSSKSLLLVKILEFIHFPELLSSYKFNDAADFADFMDKSLNSSKNQDLCAKFILKQSKITEVLSASQVAHEDEEIEEVSLPEKEVCKVTVPELKLDNSSKSLPLIQRLLNITVPKGLKKVCSDLKSPPSTVQIFSTEELSHTCMKSYITVESKSTSILNVLNKKMKAKLKRKSKELGRNISFKGAKRISSPERILYSSQKSVNISENPPPDTSLDIFHKPEGKPLENGRNEPDGILFDIDFDLPDPFEDDLFLCTDDISDVKALPNFLNENDHAALQDNAKKLDSNCHLDKTSDFDVTPAFLDRNEHTVSKNAREIDTASFNVDSQGNRENFLPSVLSGENAEVLSSLPYEKIEHPIKSTREEINLSNVPAVSDLKFLPKFSKDCNYSDSNNIILDSPKLSVGYVGNAISEVKRINKYEDVEQVKLNLNKVDNYQNISSENGYDITNPNLNVTSNNSKLRKLLKEKVSNEFNNNICSTTVHESLKGLNQNSLSFLANPNELTEIYRHSFVDKSAENINDCSFGFDISFGHKNNEGKLNTTSNRNDTSSESTKVYALPKGVNLKDDLEELDKDANSILEQLLTSQKNISTDINTSFSSPLTVKRCISENDKNENSLNGKKFCKTPLSSHNLPNSSFHKTNKFNNSEAFEVLNLTDHLNHAKFKSPKNKFDKIENLTDASQYTLTQLLSLIDSTETVEKNTQKKPFNNEVNNMQENYEISALSSEDEVCPTPPKEVVKPKSDFIYSKKSVAKKSLRFGKHNSLQKDTEIVQKFVCGASNNQESKETAKFDKFTPERVGKIQTDTLKDPSVTLENEMGGIVALAASPKITFDVSFDLPFTQEEFGNSKNQVFDMNNAIIVESSPTDSKLKSNPCNDSDKLLLCKHEKVSNLLHEMPSSKVNIFQKCSQKDDDYLSDDLVEDSESLLPSVQIDNDGNLALPHTNLFHKGLLSNKIGNSESTYQKSFEIGQALPEKSLKSVNAEEHFIATSLQSNENCAVLKAKPQMDSSSTKGEVEDFKNSIFFKLLSGDPSPYIPNSVSTDFKTSDIQDGRSKTDFEDGKESILLKNNKYLKELKETGSNSNLLHLNHSKFSSKSKPQIDENSVKDGINPHYNEKQLNDTVIVSELQPEDIIVKKVCRSDMNSDYHNSMIFSEDKVCFDLSFDDDYDKTCDILPKEYPDILGNGGKISGKQSDVQKTEENYDQSCVKNSLTFEECSLPKLFEKAKEKEEFKSVARKSIFRKNDSEPDRSIGKLTTSNDEIMLEFDLLDDDQNFMLELEEDKHSSLLHVEQESTVRNVDDNNSSDDFDFQNPNQISVFKMPNQVCSNPVPRKYAESTDDLPSGGKITTKLSSKLSVKSNKISRTVLKGNSVIDDEEEDFLFIQKIHKKIDKRSKSGNKKKKLLSNKNEFLLSQAEVSGSENSDHESAYEDDDALEGSFIDDESSPKFDCTDQHAFYLKSIKNFAGFPQKFKLKAAKNETVNLENEEEYSMYQRDSFCVSDDEVAFLSSDDSADYKHELVPGNKGKRVKSKNTNKLKRVLTHDSTSSSDHDISPKIRKLNKETSIASKTNNDNYSFVAVRKKKPKIILSSDEENENAFNQPPHSKSQENHKKHQSDNINSKNSSMKPELNFDDNDKLIFSIDFGDDDFLSLNDVNKIEDKISMNLFSPQKGRSISNNGACVSNFPTTSKAGSLESHFAISNKIKSSDCGSHSSTSNSFSSKVAMNLNNHFHMKTNSSDAKVSKYDKDELLVMKSSRCVDLKTYINAPNNSNFSNYIPSTSTPIKCNNFESKTINDVETIENDNEIPDISFNIWWDEICQVENVNEDPSMKSAKEEKITFVAENKDKNEIASIILVDSRELASGKPVVSALRNIHKINPVIMQLPSTDYILSSRIAVERILDSEFSGSPMPPKVVDKIKQMEGIYEKSVIIIEKDNRKNILSFNKDVTKYLKFIVYLNSCPSVQVLFSKSVEHTSELIAKLIEREKKKGLHINVPVELNAKQKILYNFYSSFPKMSPVCALNLMYYFPKVELFLKSSVKDIQNKGCISSHKALSIFNFIHSKLTFHENM